MKLHVGHDPSFDIDPEADYGTDVLLTTFDDGTQTVAFRPGQDRRDLIWSAPVYLEVTA